MSGAIPVARGCGTRQAGGIYAETGLTADGLPVEAFLMDPPVEIPAHLHLAPQGVAWVERDGCWHMVDWVGSQHYPNVADFIEEVRRFGLSRRIPRTAPFERLGPDSRILLVHARAILAHPGPTQYRPAESAPYACPQAAVARWENLQAELKGKRRRKPLGLVDALKTALHEKGETLCAGLWWEDVEGGVEQEGGTVRRRMPAFSYGGKARPAGVEPEYQPGFFASFPLHRLVVVRDPAHGTHEAARAAAQQARLPLEEVDQ